MVGLLGYAFGFEDHADGRPSECVLHALDSLIVASPSGTQESPVFHATRATCSLPALAEAAAGSGFLNAMPDADGRSRSETDIAAADVLNGSASADALQGAIVFVGGTAAGIWEIVSTPYDRVFPGVEVHATVADNLLRRDFLARSPDAQTFELLAVQPEDTAIR